MSADSSSGIHSEGPAAKQVALPGSDGHKAEQLLRASQRQGVATLGMLARAAVTRLLASGNPQAATALFSEEEKGKLADSLAGVLASADLLGRSRIRLRLEQAKRHAGQDHHFSEADSLTDFSCFDEGGSGGPLKPMSPRQALDYFRGLVPQITLKASDFVPAMEHRAFTVAGITEKSLLERIQEIIGKGMETGKVGGIEQHIDDILDEAGVTPRNPGRAESVYRTNMMSSFAEGGDDERQHPDVIEDFPVWIWRGIRDGRQRHSHEVHFDKIFPAKIRFSEVRDSVKGEFDGYQDRCIAQPVYKSEWARLQADGARIAEGWG